MSVQRGMPGMGKPGMEQHPDDTFLVCWIGWLPLAFVCGVAFGLIVGASIGVLLS